MTDDGDIGGRRVDGAQIIRRVFDILRLIAHRSPGGGRLKDLAEAAGLPRPTVHRILQALAAERIVRQDPASKRYQLGPFAFELGLAAPQQTRLIELSRPVLHRLAARTEDTIYLVARSGMDAVCIDRIQGSFPIRTFTLDVGDRRPLGVGAAGLALLGALGDADVDAVIERCRGEFPLYGGLTAEAVREGVAAARATGFGLSREKLTLGVSGIGIAVPRDGGPPFVGVSVAAISERILGPRRDSLQTILKEEALALSTLLAAEDAA